MSRLVATALLLFSGGSCVEVSGGAVEARWNLRDWQDAHAVSCSQLGVTNIRFQLLQWPNNGTDPCAADLSCQFPCNSQTGATHFIIPPGDYAMSLEAIDVNGDPLGPPQVVVPAPVTRSVLTGKVTDLGVNLILVKPP